MTAISNSPQDYNNYTTKSIDAFIDSQKKNQPIGISTFQEFAQKQDWVGNDTIDTVFLSESAQELYIPENLYTSKTFSSGTYVNIEAKYTQTTNGAGEDVQSAYEVFATINKKDGSSERIQITENSMISENENGEIIIGSANNIQGTSNDELFVMLDNFDELITGDGDDTVLLLASNTNKLDSVKNDEATLGDTNNINLGKGNNTVIANHSVNSHFNIFAEDGDNTITGVSGNIELGDGDNTIDMNYSSYIVLGDGDNKVKAEQLENLKIGNGDNNVDIDSVSSNIVDIHIGSGNNKVRIDEVFSNGMNFSVGNGNNNVIIDELSSHGAGLSFGGGNNYFEVSDASLRNGALTTRFGNSNNNVDMHISDSVDVGIFSAYFGHGNNTVDISRVNAVVSNIEFGDGNNNVDIGSYNSLISKIEFGNGNNTVDIDRYQSLFSDIEFGDGNNELNAGVFNAGHRVLMLLGNGSNMVSTKVFGSLFSNIELGSGNNTLNFNQFMSVATGITTGDGNNFFTFSSFSSSFFERDDNKKKTVFDIKEWRERDSHMNIDEKRKARFELHEEVERIREEANAKIERLHKKFHKIF